MTSDWAPTACVFCSLNCGLEVQTEGRAITAVRGDKQHPGSKGYLCEKAQRIGAYQSAGDRLTSPLRKRADGTFEAVSWDVAIDEVATRLAAVRDAHGGDKILFYGGGGQGNHLGGVYGDATLKSVGVKYRSNALAQEKTGEFWVNGKMLGAGVHGDFEHAEVGLFIGKNPWQSHGFARARTVINAFKKDPARTLIVIDPRRSETAARADIHLRLLPGTDAWCLAALVAIVIQEDLVDDQWVKDHTDGVEQIRPLFADIDVAAYAAFCGVPEALLRQTARCIAKAKSVATFEDLGMQMNRHSTLGSYLQRLLWMLTGHFGKRGANNAFVPFLSIAKASKGNVSGKEKPRQKRVSPVVGAKIVIGLIPCNVMAEEILTDHPNRFRAMIIESGNPVHSVADSPKMRDAMAALDFSVVIDVAMTETARCADYVLPAASQFEKAECTFFNLDVPDNTFHLRHALFAPLPGTLPEAEIHSRLVERLKGITARHLRPLRLAAKLGRPALAAALFALLLRHKDWIDAVPVLLYRALGPELPKEAREAAALWAICHLYARAEPAARAGAGYGGPALLAGERLFDDVISGKHGVVFAASSYEASWDRVRTPGGRLQLALPELFSSITALASGLPTPDREFPLVLSAGERRSETTNTLLRDPSGRPKGGDALRLAPADASAHGLAEGDRVRLSTRRGSVEVDVEITDMMQPGHMSLPNGFGLAFEPGGMAGVPTNELTRAEDRDPFVGTPWHKHVPARIEALGSKRT